MVFALSRTGMLRSDIKSYEIPDLIGQVRRRHTFDPLTPKISSVILLTVCDIVLLMLVQRI